jgi:hypothetical protein
LDWDANSNMFIAVAAPTGGLGSFPALVKGDTGDVPTLRDVNFTVLEVDDVTPDSADWVLVSPGLYDLDLALHKGPQGDIGDTVLTPSDFGTPVAGKIPVVNSTLDDFELQSPKVGDRFVAASYTSAPSGQPVYQIASISIPAQNFDWRPEVSGSCVVTVTSANVRADLVARLNDPASGNIVGRGFGTVNTSHGSLATVVNLASGPPAAASSSYDKVAQGSSAIIYLRVERQAGTGTFTTSDDTTWFCVRVCPIP